MGKSAPLSLQHCAGPARCCPWDLVVWMNPKVTVRKCQMPPKKIEMLDGIFKTSALLFLRGLQYIADTISSTCQWLTRRFLKTSDLKRCPISRAWVAVAFPAPTPVASLGQDAQTYGNVQARFGCVYTYKRLGYVYT